jgi:hypothetical protein
MTDDLELDRKLDLRDADRRRSSHLGEGRGRFTGWIILTIQDDGVGIAAEYLPKVFDAFFTTRRTWEPAVDCLSRSSLSKATEVRLRLKAEMTPKIMALRAFFCRWPLRTTTAANSAQGFPLFWIALTGLSTARTHMA